MQIHVIRDAAEWDGYLLQFRCHHPLQTLEWAKVKASFGWRAGAYLLEEKGKVLGATLVLTRRWGKLPWKVMYVPRGPVLDYNDEKASQAMLAFLEEKARQEKAIFVKIDPEVPEGHPFERVLRDRGWHPSGEQVQFRSTILLDLTLDEDELLRRMKQKTRYNIRLAGRRGVRVRGGRPGDLPLFYRMYRITSIRNGFPIRPYEYYECAWRTFLEADKAFLLVAEHQGQPLAGVIIFHLGEKAVYMYGASTNEKRNLMPNYLLQWEAIRRAKQRGCTVYDMWGAPDNPTPNSPMWGVYRFKRGFGGSFIRYIGAYDFVISPVLYTLYGSLIPAYLALLRMLKTTVRFRPARNQL